MVARLTFLGFLFIALTAQASPQVCSEVFGPRVVPPLSAVAQGLQKLKASEAPYFYVTDWGLDFITTPDDMFGYGKMMKQSFRRPMFFVNKENDRVGGIAAYKGNIFAEGYYREQDATKEKPIRQMMRQQPWLEWNETTFSYIVKRGNPVRTLLAPWTKNGKVTIYRGLSKDDLASVLEAQRTGRLEDLFVLRDCMFFTPDENVMQKWAVEGVYLETTLNEADFDLAYGGIEHNYVELALTPEAVKRILPHIKVRQLAEKKNAS